jgi:NTP pyrophosphatase (non-canonical NTP hydrolase)
MTEEDRPRPAVQWFAGEMEEKLRKNDHRGPDGWKGCRFDYLTGRLMQEMMEVFRELWRANADTRIAKIDSEVARKITDECADVANFAMMIADNAMRAAGVEPSEELTPAPAAESVESQKAGGGHER